MPLTSVTKTYNPTRNLYPVGNCIELCFDGVQLQLQTGALPQINLPIATIAEIQDGSTIRLNNTTWTFATGAFFLPCEENIIEYSADNATLLANIVAALNENYNHNTEYQAIATPTEIIIYTLSCQNPLRITLTNLTGATDTVIIEDAGTPLTLKDNYRIKARFLDGLGGVLGTAGTANELQIFPFYSLDEFKCDLTRNIDICKDISDYLECFLMKELPDSTNEFLRYLTNSTKYINIEFAESWGSPLNTFCEALDSASIKIIPGVYQNDDADAADNHYAENTGYDPITTYTTLQTTICRDQEFYIYADTSLNADFFAVQANLKDVNGDTLAFNNIATTIDDGSGNLVEINLNPQKIIDFITTTFGFTGGALVRSIEILILQLSVGGFNSTSSRFEYNIEDCYDCDFETFVFCSSKGVYETISTKPCDKVFSSVVRDFITVCEPCTPNTSNRGRKTTKTTLYKEIEVYFWDSFDDKYNEAAIMELMGSRDVYWVVDGEYYAIEPLTTEVQTYKRNGKVENGFRFRLYQTKTY